MRKLSLFMVAWLATLLLMATDGATEATAETAEETTAVVEEAGKFKTALKKIFDDEEEDEEVEEKSFPLTLGLDLVSRYVWRGIDFGASPAVQPYLEYSVGNDKITWGIGAWGSYSFVGPVASELDLYSYLSLGPVTLNFTDYFLPSETWGGDAYFTYGNKNGTGHVYELMLSAGGDNFPLYGTAAINLGGADKTYSSYFELGATVYDGIDLFVGAAYDNYSGYYMARPKAGSYKFNVINVGLSASYDIDVKKVSIPLSASLVFNPEARNAWFVVAIGLSN